MRLNKNGFDELIYKRATIYADREIEGKQKKKKVAEFDFKVGEFDFKVGEYAPLRKLYLNAKIYDPAFLEVLKEWKEAYEKISSEEFQKGNIDYPLLHIENEIYLPQNSRNNQEGFCSEKTRHLNEYNLNI